MVQVVRLLLVLCALPVAAIGCGAATPPPRRVIEADLTSRWVYARYQKLFDVEIAIDGNPAEGHTAVYVNREARFRGRVNPEDLAVAFVTEYRIARGLAQELSEQLSRLQGSYDVGVERRDGGWMHTVAKGKESWVFWPSGRFIVKVGMPSHEPPVPSPIVSAYLRRFPSDLGKDGLVKPGALSAGTGPWVKVGTKGTGRTPALKSGTGP